MTFVNKVKALFTKKESKNLLSVAIRQSSIAYCYYPEHGVPTNNQIDVVNEQLSSSLTQLHHEHLNGQCHLILNASQYQIVQVDKPNVPENEIAGALTWQVKDLVSIPPDDMTVDYFDSPFSAGAPKINVVCAQTSLLKSLVDTIHQDDIALTHITTEEFAFAQLVANLQGPQLIVCQQPNEDVLILIVQNGLLCSHRRIRGLANIAQRSEEELSMGLLDNLSIEIQKSIDFFERQLKQPPVKQIHVLLPVASEAFIARKLSENTHIAVDLLKLPESYQDDRAMAVVIGNTIGAQSQGTALVNEESEPVVEQTA